MNTPTPTTRRPTQTYAGRIVAVIAAAAVAVLSMNGVAYAAEGAAAATTNTATFTGYGPGYSDVISGEDAGSYMFDVDGTAVEAYCVEMHEEFNTAGTFTITTQANSGINNIGTAAWLARNHRNVGEPLADEASEKAAVQAAIWHYTDGAVIDDTTVASPSIRARALELAGEAAGRSLGGDAAAGYEMNVEAVNVDGVVTATAVVTTTSGNPVSGVQITFNIAGQDAVATTGDNGAATVEITVTDGVVDVDATATVTIAAGVALNPGDGSQIMVTAQPITQVLSATISAVEDESSTTTVSTTPTTTQAPPVTTPTTEATEEVLSQLPYTSGETGTTWLIAGVVLAAAAFYAARRSRA